MREIKFRGKRVDNGEWVYGDLIHNAFDGYRIFPVGIKPDGSYPVEVITETVGQFTGANDNNYEDIYGGTILQFSGAPGMDDGIAAVVWNKTVCAWYIENDDANIYDYLYNVTGYCVVLGNIHENPELLEVTK